MQMNFSAERQTMSEAVFDKLFEQIISLKLRPGTKVSEAEVAEQFGVSRQPVRDAFARLEIMKLLLIKPQKATVVRNFSMSSIRAARFVRLAVELEIAHAALLKWNPDHSKNFEAIIADQEKAVVKGDTKAFHFSDQKFHKEIARVAETPEAFELVMNKKALVDRICVLSLKEKDEMQKLVEDHKAIFASLSSGDETELRNRFRLHLSRIDNAIKRVQESHSEYFDEA